MIRRGGTGGGGWVHLKGEIAQLHHPLIGPIVLSLCRAPIPALKANFYI